MTLSSSAGRPTLLTPQLGIMLAFFIQAFIGGALFPRIPDFQQGLGLSESQLGLTLIGQPIGALTSILFASWFIERFGPKAILSVSVPSIALGTLLIAVAPDMLVAFVAMYAYGLSFAMANVAMNVEADRVEAMTGTRVMNRCHGLWSLGFLTTSVLGAAARGIPLTPLVHFALLVPVVLAVCAVVIWPMRTTPPRPHAGGAGRKRVLALPTLATLVLVGVILSGVMADTTVRAWSVIFMRDSFTAPEWVDALTLPAFLVTATAGRMAGDPLVERFGPSRVAAVLLVLAMAGLAVVLLATHPVVALVGFAMMGAGISVIFPLTMSAAARIGDRPASENVTAVSLATNLIMLGTPALIGFVADAVGIRNAFLMLVPVLVVALVLVRALEPRGNA